MPFKQRLSSAPVLAPIVFIPFLNLILLLTTIYLLVGTHLLTKGVPVRFPKTITSDSLSGQNLILTITGEDVIYFENTICSVKDLLTVLSKPENRARTLLIRVDRRASAGRVFDVWNSCRKIGMEKINIATTKD